MTYNLWGRYKTNNVEKIDTFYSKREAQRCLGEYRMAFSSDWKLWLGRKKDEP